MAKDRYSQLSESENEHDFINAISQPKRKTTPPYREQDPSQIQLDDLETHISPKSSFHDPDETGTLPIVGKENAVTTPNRRTAPRRLTSYLVAVTAVSYVCLVGRIAFTIFLWYGNESNHTWHYIIRSSWIARTVTLLALTLRMAISVQASIATSMLAAIAMEHTGVDILYAPEFSFARFSHNGPLSLLTAYLKQPKPHILVLLLAILALSTGALQFSSTLLLSDMAPAPLTSTSSNASISYGFQWNKWQANFTFADLIAKKYGNVMMDRRPSFGEYRISPGDHGDVDDTGSVIRALIPLADQSAREWLQSYQGPASLFDSRVACTQPGFVDLRPCSGLNDTICGTVMPRRRIENSVVNLTGVDFACPVPRPADYCGALWEDDLKSVECETEPAWSACRLLRNDGGGLMSSLDPTVNDSLAYTFARSYWYNNESDRRAGKVGIEYEDNFGSTWSAGSQSKTWPVELGNAWLLFNVTTDIMERWTLQRNQSTSFIDETRYSGPWTDTELVLQDDMEFFKERATFRASLCYDALPKSGSHFHVEDFNVSLESHAPRKEPLSRSDARTGRFDTSEIRLQFGAVKDSHTPDQRGILQLSGIGLMSLITDQQHQWTPWEPPADVFKFVPGPVNRSAVNATLAKNWFRTDNYPTHPWLVDTAADTATNVVFCIYCIWDKSNADNADFWNSCLFNDILVDTGSPALALQSYLMSRQQGLYYSHLPFFNKDAEVATTSFIVRPAPVSTTGFFIVMGPLLIHLVVCSVTVILFLAKTQYSYLGNAWTAFAQVANSEETQSILVKSMVKTDKEVEQEIKASSGMDLRYRLVAVDEGNGVTLRQVGESGVGSRKRLQRGHSSSSTNPLINRYSSATVTPLWSLSSLTAVDSGSGYRGY